MKNTLKKAVSVVLTVALAMCFASCGNEAKDITSSLENLGINNADWWHGSSAANVLSKNPYDMINYNEKIFISGGNYCDNTGGVPINYYQNGSDTATETTIIPSEQVDEFYIYDNVLYCTEVDPKEWGNADTWYYTDEAGKWKSGVNVLSGCIHCYDMEKYDGCFFFSGSDIDSNDSSIPIIYRTEKAVSEAAADDYEVVPFYDKDGNLLTHGTLTDSFYYGDGELFVGTFTARFHDLIIFNNELYAFYYSAFREVNDHDGFYKYDKELGGFIFDETKDSSYLRDIFAECGQDDQKILHDFTYSKKLYMILSGEPDCLVVTEDLKTFEKVVIPGFEDASVHDCIFIDNVPYLLASRKTEDGYINYVFKTLNFKTYKTVFTFTEKLLARSFEYSKGQYYFCLGFNYKHDKSGNVVLPEGSELCGTVLRYNTKKK